MMEQMNNISQIQLKANTAFVDNLIVLLVAYFNFGMCQLKTAMKSSEGRVAKVLEEANSSFQHALKISNRYLGTHHYFS